MTLTVTVASIETRLTTVAAAKAELQVTTEADDGYLGELIDQASDVIRSWCRREFAAETVRETIDQRSPSLSLMLARFPVVAIADATAAGQALDVARLEVEDGGFIYHLNAAGNRVSWPPGRIVIDYQSGFLLPGQQGRNLPGDVERAALVQVGAWYRGRGRDPLVRSETVDGVGRTDYFSGSGTLILPEMEALLSPYRVVSLG